MRSKQEEATNYTCQLKYGPHMPRDYGAATGSELHPVHKFILVVIKYKILFHHCYADYSILSALQPWVSLGLLNNQSMQIITCA
jgi:hypothetical protein